jgi:hypothetical protein
MPARLLLLRLLFRSSWLTVGGQVGSARVLHRRGERAAVGVPVGVAAGVPLHQRAGRWCQHLPLLAEEQSGGYFAPGRASGASGHASGLWASTLP